MSLELKILITVFIVIQNIYKNSITFANEVRYPHFAKIPKYNNDY